MRRIGIILVLGLAALVPGASNDAQSSGCRVTPRDEVVGLYPETTLSPLESLVHFDAAFLGEVAVPTKRCSLGYCAGIHVLKTVKGQVDRTVLLQVAGPGTTGPCGPASFLTKGDRWMIFANHGTSKGGLKYLRAEDDGPSFAANEVPDFRRLEQRYRVVRAELDQALEERIGRVR